MLTRFLYTQRIELEQSIVKMECSIVVVTTVSASGVEAIFTYYIEATLLIRVCTASHAAISQGTYHP